MCNIVVGADMESVPTFILKKRRSPMPTLTYQSPIGPLYIAEQDSAITHLVFSPIPGEAGTSPLLEQCVQQLTAYFSGSLRQFDLPLAPHGTAFQKKVWHALLEIPYGETWSYKMLAQAANSPKGYRAVGLANNRNPISVLIPCHRVVGIKGALTGYGGGLDKKAQLLNLEGVALPR